MRITIEINNPYYSDGLASMAKGVKMSPDDLCRELLCNIIEKTVEGKNHWEHDFVYWQLPERVRKNLNERD